MKKLFLLLLSACTLGSGAYAFPGDTTTLDLSKPLSPESFDFDVKGRWTDLYEYKDYPFIEFNDEDRGDVVMTFSHKNTVFELWQQYYDIFDTEEEVDDFMDEMYLTDGYWDGFTISTNGDSSHQDPWFGGNDNGNMAGGGIKTDANGKVVKDTNGRVLTDKSRPYLVGYVSDMSWAGISTPAAQTLLYEPRHAVGMYVNAAPWAYYNVREGDGFARALNQEGDYLKLIIHGLDENYEDNGKKVEYYIAKYENDSLYQSADWEWVDLAALGEVGGFYYTMETTDENKATPMYFCMDKLQVCKAPVDYTFTITAPKAATVYVGEKGSKSYVPFTEKAAVRIVETDTSRTWCYNVSKQHSYRVSMAGGLTQAGLFTPSASENSLVLTAADFSAHSPRETNHDVTANGSYNVADIFLNINERGYLKLAAVGDTFALVPLRTWQLTNSTTMNYFLEPDYRYTVLNEGGEADNSVVTVDEKGVVRAVSGGTALVQVTYDAINVPSAMGGAFWGALWAENTGVFVVSVGTAASGITPHITINDSLNNESTAKLAAAAVDAELDVLYYLADSGSYRYTFKPDGVSSVQLAQPTIAEEAGEEVMRYSGFSPEGVTTHANGSYTLRLLHGRNVVKMVSSSGAAEYQVLTAKKVSYTLSNHTNPGSEELLAGDSVLITFNTLYHPADKLAGIYNMTAGIQYSSVREAKISAFGGSGQYAFAAKAQTYGVRIPQDCTGSSFTISGGVIKASGYGSPYGTHRSITPEGFSANMNAALQNAYFGALPGISLPVTDTTTANDTTTVTGVAKHESRLSVYPTVANGELTVENEEFSILNSQFSIEIYSLNGTLMLTQPTAGEKTTVSISHLPSGTYIVRMGRATAKIVKQ